MITTHILDTSAGIPAVGVRVTLARVDGSARTLIGDGTTDSDGRLRTLVPEGAQIQVGIYELTFETGPYFAARGMAAFHPRVTVAFRIENSTQHFHVPLLLSPFGYTTYRGS